MESPQEQPSQLCMQDISNSCFLFLLFSSSSTPLVCWIMLWIFQIELCASLQCHNSHPDIFSNSVANMSRDFKDSFRAFPDSRSCFSPGVMCIRVVIGPVLPSQLVARVFEECFMSHQLELMSAV
jgi:hypothetical protein